MAELRFAVVGAGFWARYQLAAWGEAARRAMRRRLRPRPPPGRGAGRRLRRAGSRTTTSPRCSSGERPDFVDVITDAPRPCPARAARGRGRQSPSICQKPMAPTLAECEELVAVCRAAGVLAYRPRELALAGRLRSVKELLAEGRSATLPLPHRLDLRLRRVRQPAGPARERAVHPGRHGLPPA